jgi:hypothetical protein
MLTSDTASVTVDEAPAELPVNGADSPDEDSQPSISSACDVDIKRSSSLGCGLKNQPKCPSLDLNSHSYVVTQDGRSCSEFTRHTVRQQVLQAPATIVIIIVIISKQQQQAAAAAARVMRDG